MAIKDKIVNLEGLKAVNDAMQEQVDHKAEIDGYYQDMTVGDAEQLISSQYVEDSVPYLFRPTGGSVDVGNRSDTEAIVGGTIAWNQLTPDTQAENTAAGDIVSVDDASAENAVSVKASFEPVQDLHGYDHPWPGGDGKNLFDISQATDARQYTFVDGVGTMSLPYSQSGNVIVYPDGIKVTSGETYTISADVYLSTDGSNENRTVAMGLKPGTNAGAYTKNDVTVSAFDTWQRISSTVTAPGDTVWVGIQPRVAGHTVQFKNVQVEAGSTATDWTPYSNICPITGFEGLTVTRCGKNLFDLNEYTLAGASVYTDGEYPDSFTGNKHAFYFLHGSAKGNPSATGLIGRRPYGQLTISFYYYSTANTRVYFHYTDAEAWENHSGNISTVGYKEYTSNANRVCDGVALETIQGATATFWIGQLQVEIGAHATAYESPVRTTLPVSWQTEAGTVYGGELDVTTGVLTVDRVSVDLGTLFYTYASNFDCFTAIPGRYELLAKNQFDAICSAYQFVGSYQRLIDKSCAYIYNNYIAIRDSKYGEDVQAFTAAMSGVQLVYPLATPQTYTLTAQQLQMLLGENNVWNDAGSTTLTYISPNKHHTLTSGRKYLARISGANSVLTGAGQEIVAACGTDNLFDLTQMWGTSIADYIASTGGAAWFRNYFPDAVYPYNAGELRSVEGLESHDCVGFNAWDEEWEVGGFNDSTGEKNNATNIIRSKNYIPVIPNGVYYFKTPNTLYPYYYDADKNFLVTGSAANNTKTMPSNCHYIRFSVGTSYGTTYKNDICINLSHSGARNGEYEPYVKHSYPLDSSVILRGIPKLDSSNSLYFDGDRYLPDGTVTRKYRYIDLGSLQWFRTKTGTNYVFQSGYLTSSVRKNDIISVISADYLAATNKNSASTAYNNGDKTICMVNGANPYVQINDDSKQDLTAEEFKAFVSGMKLLYELATPTTEQAAPYQQHQIVSDWGTEEFVSTSIVPVGHETRYSQNLRDKLQHLPDLATADGLYLIQQSGSQMSLQSLPATAGKYALRVTVSGGIPSYTWEAVT